MLFNKNNTRKINDKKILHKVGKQWKVISVALLMAIGGGAVATHAANADTTDANAGSVSQQSMNSGSANTQSGISASTAAEISSLEAKPSLSAGSNTSASTTSVTSSSAQPSSAVSYLNNNGGSAASYHAKALNDNSEITVNQLQVNSIESANSAIGSADNKAVQNTTEKSNDDAALASAFGKIASGSDYNAKVSSLAAKSGQTTTDYVASLEYNYNSYSSAISNGTKYINQLNKVVSGKNTISSVLNNQNEYSLNATIANAQANAAQSIYDATNASYNNLSTAAVNAVKASNSASLSYAQASTADDVALINSGMDSSTTTSLASSLGYKNNSAVNSALSNFARNYNSASTAYTFTTASNESAKLSKANGTDFSNVSQVISDIAAMNSFNNSHYSQASTVPKFKLDSASDAVASAKSALNSAKASASSANVLATVTSSNSASALTSLVGSDASAAINALNGMDSSAMTNYINNESNSLSTESNASTSYRNAEDDYYALDSYFASSYANNASSDASAVTSATNALNNLYDGLSNGEYTKATSALKDAKQNYANDKLLANAYGVNVYNHGPKYVSVTTNLRMHTSTHYSDANAIANISKGSILRVLGVGFDNNGMLRYTVNVNGQQGFITGDPDYTQATYLMASADNQNVSVKATRNIREYRNGKPVKMIKAGTVLKNVTVVGQADNNFNNQAVLGAFSRVQLANGDMVTANTGYVQLVNNTKTNPVPNTPAKPSNQPLVIFG